MPANMRKLMGEVPRSLEIAARDAKDAPAPIGRESLSRKEVARRVEPLLGMLAHGDIPLDPNLAKAFAAYVEETNARR